MTIRCPVAVAEALAGLDSREKLEAVSVAVAISLPPYEGIAMLARITAQLGSSSLDREERQQLAQHFRDLATLIDPDAEPARPH